MTGGAGEDSGGGEPTDDYLLLDGSNNNPSPFNYLRPIDADELYLSLGGGTLTGILSLDLNQTAGTLSIVEWFGGTSFNDTSGSKYLSFGGTDPSALLSLWPSRATFNTRAVCVVDNDPNGRSFRNITIGNQPTSQNLGDIWATVV